MKEVLRDEALVEKLANQDVNELDPREARLLAEDRSLQSLREYDPEDAAPADHVVEMADRRSRRLGDVIDDDTLPYNVRAEAQALLDEKETARTLKEPNLEGTPELTSRRSKDSKDPDKETKSESRSQSLKVNKSDK